MELRQLRHFLAVIDCGSLGDAARGMKMSQPALTKSIQALERSLGAPLFTRSNQGMAPTPFGRSLENRARLIGAEVDRAQIEFDEMLGSRRGSVKIGASPGAVRAILPKALVRFLRAHPMVEVTVAEAVPDVVARRVKMGELDYALTNLSQKSIDESLTGEMLLPHQRAIVVAAADHPLATRRRIVAKDIWPGPWLLQKMPDPLRRELIRFFHKAGLPPPVAAVEHDSALLAKSLLAEGKFFAYVSELYVREEIKSGKLRALPVSELTQEWNIGVIYRRESPIMPAAATLLDHIRAVCARLPRH